MSENLLEVGLSAPLPFAVKLFSAAIGGVVPTITIFPIDFVNFTAAEGSSFVHIIVLLQVKTRLQNQSSRTHAYTGMIDCARRSIALRGVSGLYRGLIPNVIGVAENR